MGCANCREETQAVQEEQLYYKMHQKQMEAQQDNAWMDAVPEWHDAELAGQNKPWTVPSQLLTAEEEVRHSVQHYVCTCGISMLNANPKSYIHQI